MIAQKIIRIATDPTVLPAEVIDQRTRSAPFFHVGDALEFQLGLFRDGALQTHDTLSKIEVVLQRGDISDTAVGEDASIITPTLATWKAGTGQHASVTIPSSGTKNLTPGYYLARVVVTDETDEQLTLQTFPIYGLQSSFGPIGTSDFVADGEQSYGYVDLPGTTGIVDVAYPTAFASAPAWIAVQCNAPDGSNDIEAAVLTDSITSTGFKVQLFGDVPAGEIYRMTYEAQLATSATQGKDIVPGASTGKISVTYAALGGAPDFALCHLAGPEGAPLIDARIVVASISTTGFDVQLFGDTPAGTTYVLYWKVVEIADLNHFKEDLSGLSGGKRTTTFPTAFPAATNWAMCQLQPPDTKAGVGAHIVKNSLGALSLDTKLMADLDTGTYKLMVHARTTT